MFNTSSSSNHFRDFFTKKPLWKYLALLLLLTFGLASSSYGLYTLINTQHSQEIVAYSGNEAEICEKNPDFGQLTVYISGAIKHPGVYVLETGDRVVDLLTAAGGLSNAADKNYLNKQLNFAQKLADAEQYYIPTRVETQEILTNQAIAGVSSNQSSSTISNDTIATNNTSPTVSNLISINTATSKELEQLPGIGPARSQAIIENRPYNSINNLLEKKVLGQSLFDQIKDKITL
jgi:competence protein ComEA